MTCVCLTAPVRLGVSACIITRSELQPARARRTHARTRSPYNVKGLRRRRPAPPHAPHKDNIATSKERRPAPNSPPAAPRLEEMKN
ncbi:unnamed protein product, partial [Brenthis ino]